MPSPATPAARSWTPMDAVKMVAHRSCSFMRLGDRSWTGTVIGENKVEYAVTQTASRWEVVRRSDDRLFTGGSLLSALTAAIGRAS